MDLSFSYSKVQFFNLSKSAIGAMGSSCNSLLSLLNDLQFDKTIKKRIIMKAMSISIRSSYLIFPFLLSAECYRFFCYPTSKTIIHCHVFCEMYYSN